MNKDQVKGGMKDIAGKAQEKAGELTGSKEQQAKGLLKQGAGGVSAGKAPAVKVGAPLSREGTSMPRYTDHAGLVISTRSAETPVNVTLRIDGSPCCGELTMTLSSPSCSSMATASFSP